MSSSHRAIAATALGKVDLVEVPTPTPGPDELLVEMKYAAFSPVDVYQTDYAFLFDFTQSYHPHVIGYAGSGIVKSLGQGVTDLKVGDRVTAFTYGNTPRKPLQQFCIIPRSIAAKVPESYPLEKAASLPDNYVTAMYTLFSSHNFGLPLPPSNKFPATSAPTDVDIPFLVYGAGSSSGQFMVQMLSLAGYKNIIATASPRHHEYLKSLGAKETIDYRDQANLAVNVRKAANGSDIAIVIDSIGAAAYIKAYAPAVAAGGRVAILAPVKEGDTINNGNPEQSKMDTYLPDWVSPLFKDGTKAIVIHTYANQTDLATKDLFMPKILSELMEENVIRSNPLLVLTEGSVLERAKKALDLLRNNKVSGEKIVIKLDL